MRTFKTVCWDLETSDLDGRGGRLLTCGFKPMGEEPYVIINPNLRRPLGKRAEDRDMLVKTRDELEKYSILIGYYSTQYRFDLPMLNSRLLSYGEKPLSEKLHIDVYSLAKKHLRLKYYRLEAVSELLHQGKKTKINWEQWTKAAWDGDQRAIDYIVHHNKWDVITLERVFLQMQDFVKSIQRK